MRAAEGEFQVSNHDRRALPAPRATNARTMIAAALVIALAASGGSATAEPFGGAPRVRVAITTAESKVFTPRVSLTGGIVPKFSSNIAFRIGGKIVERRVEIGDHVTADQVLARLDTRDQQSNLDTARASLASARALLTQATIDFGRQASLFKDGFTTRTTYDQAEQQLRTKQAAVDAAQAVLDTAKEQFGYTDLKPGVAGIVTAREVEVGQVVQEGQTVLTLAQDGPRDAVFDVYEALLTEPPESQTIRVTLQSDPSVWTDGTVREVSPTVDASSGTVRVKVGLETTPARMSLGAAVIGSGGFKPRRVIDLPRAALYRWESQPAVWVVDPKTSTVTPRVVAIERYDSDRIILSAGVAPGERVVTAGIQFLYPGLQVEAVATEPNMAESRPLDGRPAER
jgi:RND family efflux transporter MFP subunit